LRATGWGGVPAAIVSANAFDKGLQAEASDGRPADQAFFVKPVRRDDLTGWLSQQLGLRWVFASTTTPPAAARPAAAPLPPAHDLLPLLELVRLGYYKGIVRWLDEWVAVHPEQIEFAQGLRSLAREFRFEAIEQRLLSLDVDTSSSDRTS
jgi:hypothetical protein